MNSYDFSKTKLTNDKPQVHKNDEQSIIYNLSVSNSVFCNPYIIGLITIIITSLVGKYNFMFIVLGITIFNKILTIIFILFSVYCYGFSFNTKYIPLIKSEFNGN